MINRSILTLYLSRLFTKVFVSTACAVLFIIVISNIFDTLQSFRNHSISLRDFWLLVIFKAPDVFSEITMLISLIATAIFIHILRKNNELLIIITNGIPIIKVFLIPMVLSFVFALFLLSVNSSLGPHFLQRYKKLESRILGKHQSNIMISQAGIFFSEKLADSNRIVQVQSIDVEKRLLQDLTIIITDLDNNFIERIDAKQAVLDSGYYKIDQAYVNSNYAISGRNNIKIVDNLRLPTRLHVGGLKARFEAPKLIGFWSLPSLIDKFSKSGFVPTQYQIYYYKQLFKPFALVAMAFVACCFITLNLRSTPHNYMLALSIIVGLVVFFLQEIFIKVLAYNGFNPAMAILIPIITIIFISLFVILHFQEA